jgi:hypothetical protein
LAAQMPALHTNPSQPPFQSSSARCFGQRRGHYFPCLHFSACRSTTSARPGSAFHALDKPFV